MPCVLSDGYSDGLFSTSRADKHSGELLLDDADYSSSSSPQWLRLYKLEGQDSIFTFGLRLFDGSKSRLYHAVLKLHRVGFPRILSELSTSPNTTWGRTA
jgi:hypothetical protein